MKPRSEDQFMAELEEARQRLREVGKDAEVGDLSDDEGGINCDFELPYSSLPTIRSQKWLR